MKEKLKKLLSKKIFYVILALLIIGVIEVGYAATLINSKNVSYSNLSSKLSSNNVQGAIDELYNNCKNVKEECPDNDLCINAPAASILIKNVVTSGDGLYADSGEQGKYFYRGKSPKNYLKFNNELWRILNINTDGSLKIVKDGYYSTSMAWDTDSYNTWTRPATLNTELNNTYYNSLNTSAKNMIKSEIWYIGNHSYLYDHYDGNANQTLTEDVEKEKDTLWYGKIGLFSVSEYVRTNSNSSCLTLNDYDVNKDNCKETTWLFDFDNIQWTITSYPQIGESGVLTIKNKDDAGIVGEYAENKYAIRPTINLKSTISITGGDGSKGNAFTIS